MKKYLDFVSDIADKTWDGTILWTQVANDKHSGLVSEPWNVLRQFEAPYVFNGNQGTLLCVEKRAYRYEEYLFPYVDRMCELLVLVNDQVVEWIAPPRIPWFWLSKFADGIVEASGKPKFAKQA